MLCFFQVWVVQVSLPSIQILILFWYEPFANHICLQTISNRRTTLYTVIQRIIIKADHRKLKSILQEEFICKFKARTALWCQWTAWLIPVGHTGLLFSTYSNTQLCWLRTSMEARGRKNQGIKSTSSYQQKNYFEYMNRRNRTKTFLIRSHVSKGTDVVAWEYQKYIYPCMGLGMAIKWHAG